MGELKIEYPAEILWALQQEPAEFEEQARLWLALKLYESGKVSTGIAAKLADLPHTRFLFELGSHGLSPFGEDPEDLSKDLENARRASRQ